MGELLSREQVANYLALDMTTISRFVTAGDLPVTVVANPRGGNAAWIFELDDVNSFIEACRIEPGTLPIGRPWGADRSVPPPRSCLYCGQSMLHNAGRCAHPEAVTGRHE